MLQTHFFDHFKREYECVVSADMGIDFPDPAGGLHGGPGLGFFGKAGGGGGMPRGDGGISVRYVNILSARTKKPRKIYSAIAAATEGSHREVSLVF